MADRCGCRFTDRSSCPYGVDEYDLGLYQTPAGPLYVNAGIGYIYGYNFRFNCRPEITVIEI